MKCSHAAVTSYLKEVRMVVTFKSFKLVAYGVGMVCPGGIGGCIRAASGRTTKVLCPFWMKKKAVFNQIRTPFLMQITRIWWLRRCILFCE